MIEGVRGDSISPALPQFPKLADFLMESNVDTLLQSFLCSETSATWFSSLASESSFEIVEYTAKWSKGWCQLGRNYQVCGWHFMVQTFMLAICRLVIIWSLTSSTMSPAFQNCNCISVLLFLVVKHSSESGYVWKPLTLLMNWLASIPMMIFRVGYSLARAINVCLRFSSCSALIFLEDKWTLINRWSLNLINVESLLKSRVSPYLAWKRAASGSLTNRSFFKIIMDLEEWVYVYVGGSVLEICSISAYCTNRMSKSFLIRYSLSRSLFLSSLRQHLECHFANSSQYGSGLYSLILLQLITPQTDSRNAQQIILSKDLRVSTSAALTGIDLRFYWFCQNIRSQMVSNCSLPTSFPLNIPTLFLYKMVYLFFWNTRSSLAILPYSLGFSLQQSVRSFLKQELM